ncbi:hypothetical protein [Actinoplanes sp. N902-109]|uniref:hypothetical protein n=1 Tax=Actinoplanes sp. (strain N902-109) TaxID=649831 RepID=UPI00032963DD|nr:hypothetical protein [Actinoplanes sp. N902-109]AGL14046.1 hypothetical protein L083_0536 [Actinoplanes sp. N902-109]
MTATIRYYLAATIHGQRYLGPLLLFGCALAVFTINDIGPLTGSYVVSAGSLLLAMCWLTVTIANLEDPARRAITVVTAGGPGRALAAVALLALLAAGVLIGVGTVFPIVSGHHVVTGTAVVSGVLAQAVAAWVGIGVGLLCSRLVVPRPGYSLLLALAAVMAVPLVPGLPPVNPVLRLMSHDNVSLLSLTGYLAIAGVVLLAAVTATHLLSVRRD